MFDSSKPVTKKKFGILFQPLALWVGAHYSKAERRWCINVIPCVTIFIVLVGGRAPKGYVKPWKVQHV